jgi:hypothetical protein
MIFKLHFEDHRDSLEIIRGPQVWALLKKSLNSRSAVTFEMTYSSSWALWLTPIIPATWEMENMRIIVQIQPGQIICETPISKITRVKWTGGLAQTIEHLLCKCEALSSNSSPSKTHTHTHTPEITPL